MLNTHCILCGAHEIESKRGYETHNLGECKKCGFVFMLEIPSSEELTRHYSQYNYTERPTSKATLKTFNERLELFEKFRLNNLLLDTGCGRGEFLQAALEKNWQVSGTEFSPEAIKTCTRKGIKMFLGDLTEYKENEGGFDVIYSSEVIEHVKNPMEQLKAIQRLLRPGGCCYITTPNFNCYLRYKHQEKYCIIEYPEHLGFFTRETLGWALRQSGFTKMKLFTTGISISRSDHSLGKTEKKDINFSKDEKLRSLAAENRFWDFSKKAINSLLNFSSTGFTLKAIAIKPDDR